MAADREYRLWMELNTFDVELSMTQTHDESVLGVRSDLKDVRNRTALNDE